MAKKPKSALETVDELKPIRERFEKIADLREKDFKRYREDIKFLYDDMGHWPKEVVTAREQDRRLTLQVDKLLQYQHQVVNDSRMNRPQIKVTPVSGGAKETAEIFDGLLRHVQDASSADLAYDTALECATGGGFGFIRVLHERPNENATDPELAILQELFIRAVPNPLQVYFGSYKEPDGSDVQEVFICEDVPKAEFEEEWPDADMTSWTTDGQKYGDWIGENIRVAERFWLEKKERVLNILPDGSVISDEDYQKAKAQLPPDMLMPPISDQRVVKMNVVKWAKFCGSCYLDQPQDTIWTWIPVVPVWGNIQNIDGEVRHVSMIHNSKDAQLLYDYSRSAFAERVGQTPDSPMVAAAGQVDPYIAEWDGTTNVKIKRYEPQDIMGTPVPAPHREQAPDLPTGFAQDMQLSEHDIQGTLGMYQASLGRQGNASSGVQEREQARKGDVATFHYHDNLARGIKQIGRICVYAAPKVYDTKREVRILGVDGSAETVTIDPQQKQAFQKVGNKSIYNLTLGTYGVTVSVGPSYQTRRQEAAAEMAQLAASDPQFLPLYGDIYFKMQDGPFSDELSKRAKLLLPPQIQQAEQDTGQHPEVQAAIAQGKQAIAERDQALQQMQGEYQKQAADVAALKADKTASQNELLVKDAEIRLRDKELLLKAHEADLKTAQFNLDRQLALQGAHEKQAKEEGGEVTPQAAPQPIHIHPGDSVNAGIDVMQQAAAQMAQAFGVFTQAIQRIEAIAAAPRHKESIATKLPDGSFRLESTETIQ